MTFLLSNKNSIVFIVKRSYKDKKSLMLIKGQEDIKKRETGETYNNQHIGSRYPSLEL